MVLIKKYTKLSSHMTSMSIKQQTKSNYHMVGGPTRGRAIKEEIKAASRDWVDNQTCSL